jgi:hypothetical protein
MTWKGSLRWINNDHMNEALFSQFTGNDHLSTRQIA